MTDNWMTSTRASIDLAMANATPDPTIPEQITVLTETYVASGGDPADLIDAINSAVPEPTA